MPKSTLFFKHNDTLRKVFSFDMSFKQDGSKNFYVFFPKNFNVMGDYGLTNIEQVRDKVINDKNIYVKYKNIHFSWHDNKNHSNPIVRITVVKNDSQKESFISQEWPSIDKVKTPVNFLNFWLSDLDKFKPMNKNKVDINHDNVFDCLKKKFNTNKIFEIRLYLSKDGREWEQTINTYELLNSEALYNYKNIVLPFLDDVNKFKLYISIKNIEGNKLNVPIRLWYPQKPYEIHLFKGIRNNGKVYIKTGSKNLN